jgi:uncharacterized membrane protein YqjE
MPDRYPENNGRTLSQVIAEIKDETKEFVQTRVSMFVSEMREKTAHSKSAAIYGAIGLALLWTGFLMLTLCLVALVTVAFWGSPYAWFFGFLVIGFVWTALGAMLVIAAVRAFRGLAPERTMKVLKDDKIWLQNEARSEI